MSLISNKNKRISVIIPVYNSFKRIPSILHALNEQRYLPYEVIIIDSGSDGKIAKYIYRKKFKFFLIHKKINKAYPGKARNEGVKIAKGKYYGFIDARTIPDIFWIEKSFSNIKLDNIKCSIGHVKVKPDNFFQKVLQASSSGLENKETIVGTVIEKDLFLKTGFFIEGTRAGEDIEWINRVKKFKKNVTKRLNLNISYLGLPINLIETINKYIIYSFHTAKVDIQQNMKNSYFIIAIIILSLIVAKWNSLIRYFIINTFTLNANYLYIENIFQKYVLIIGLFLIIKILIEIIFYKKNYNLQFNYFFIIIFLFIAFYFVYNWNFLIAGWVYDAVWYIPHITKVFVVLTLISSLIIRGIIIPISRNINTSYLFPYNWLLVGCLGVLLDLSKAPGYLFGSLTLPFLKIFNDLFYLKHTSKAKKILVICPFPEGVQAGQRLKYEQHFPTFRNNNYEIHVKPFINLNSWRILYKKGYYINKFFGIIFGYFKRFFTIFILYRYEIVYIFMWVTPYGTGWMERIYRFFSKKIIYDIEDNILVIKKNEINPTSRFKSVKKIIYLIKTSDKIITSAPSLNEKCRSISLKNNCTYICASINLKRYIPNIEYNNNNLLTIGWTGTFSSKQYLMLVESVFKKLYKLRKYKLRIIGNFDYHIDEVDFEVIQWNKEREILDLNKIDIGFYPLNMDQDWVSGKSGLKALQYMSLGIPTVASNIGNVSSIIQNMENGILVNTHEEWLESFIKLIDNPDLRKKIGMAGRKTVINDYSTEVLTNKYLKVIKSI